MRPQLPDNILVILLRQCYLAPKCRSAIERPKVHSLFLPRYLRTSARQSHHGEGPDRDRNTVQDSRSRTQEDGSVLAQPVHLLPTAQYSTQSQYRTSPQNIAILGGGITGLSSAFYLSKSLPSANITLYEASDRLGGWLRSKHVDMGNGKIVFEQGPRTLRPHTPAALVTLELIKQLGLESEIIITPTHSVASKNRFVYYPDHLVQMPGPGQSFFGVIWRILTEPIFRGLFDGVATDLSTPQRSPNLEDESIGSFLKRRLGNTHIGDNIVSAIIHGIYAGDIYQLSMKSLQPVAWHCEGLFGSLSIGAKRTILNGEYIIQHRDALVLADLGVRRSHIARDQEMRFASVYSFKQGIGALSDALVAALKANPKVCLRTNDPVQGISFDSQTDRLKVSTAVNKPTENFNHVISTIPGRILSSLTDNASDLSSLSSTHAVTVMVVNLYYTNPSLLPVHGFGYLIPRSVPWDQNPEFALGVVFDSDTSIGQDTTPGTKVTVMLGGHWWDDWSFYPDEAEGAAMAKAILRRHLKIEEEPVVVNVGLHKECIPQYTVGHEGRMKKAHQELMRVYKGKLTVAGSSYTGVGLNECVRSAKDVVTSIQSQGPGGISGLERFTTDTKWVTMPLGKGFFGKSEHATR